MRNLTGNALHKEGVFKDLRTIRLCVCLPITTFRIGQADIDIYRIMPKFNAEIVIPFDILAGFIIYIRLNRPIVRLLYGSRFRAIVLYNIYRSRFQTIALLPGKSFAFSQTFRQCII